MSSDGSQPTMLTHLPGVTMFPAWSRAGERPAFRSTQEGNREIYLIRLDRSGLTRLTTDRGDDDWPDRSPVGEQILFKLAARRQTEVYAIRFDGSWLTNLTNHRSQDLDTTWSLDGQRIALLSNRSAYVELYVMRADGRNRPRPGLVVGRDEARLHRDDHQPSCGGDLQICPVNLDRSGFTAVTTHPAVEQ